ncbi:MAG: hypothetical protein SH868_00815 [Bythopirellula sp.]|nr:hypothetical protein [Bythopirellula sp.]
MFIRTSYLRRMTSCLAILISFVGSLQQSHAFCQWTECGSASSKQATCQADHASCKCCHDEHEQIAVIEATCSEPCLTQHQNVPCQQHCWCCQASDPLRVPTDGTSSAKELVTDSSLVAVDYLFGGLTEQVASPFDEHTFREVASLTAAEFCVQLCRFRI